MATAYHGTHRPLVGAFVCAMIGACSNPPAAQQVPDDAATTRALRNDIDTIVVIYAENRAFDNLYGNFPNARGLSDVVGADGRPTSAYIPQIDRDGKILTRLPPAWGGVTAAGYSPVVTQQQSV
jgi:phospholipase C